VLRNGSAATIVCALALFTLGPAWRLGIINTLVGIALCLSLVILTGFVGQISLAQMAFAGIAGFTLSKLAEEHGVPFPIAPLLAAFAAVAVGCVAAVPALRIRGVNLAIATFAAAVAVESVVFEHPTWGGGLDGAPVPSPSIAGVKFGPNDTGGFDDTLPNPWFGVFCLAVVILLVVFVVRLRTSSLGQRMLAVRANERAAAAAGINVARTKLVGFALSAFVAGIGGALSGYRFGSVSPLFFGSMASLTLLAFAYLGGITTIGGAVAGGMLVAGGVAFTAADEWFGIGADYTLLVAGVGLILTAVCNPEGIAGAWSRLTGVRIRRPALGLPRVRTRAVAVESR
jgi:branched-chain amino acid transport system permease protein